MVKNWKQKHTFFIKSVINLSISAWGLSNSALRGKTWIQKKKHKHILDLARYILSSTSSTKKKKKKHVPTYGYVPCLEENK